MRQLRPERADCPWLSAVTVGTAARDGEAVEIAPKLLAVTRDVWGRSWVHPAVILPA